ncbi:hypothetical protein V5P93_005654 [Actinokineospora auranticolor]|nr:hypothetical protein [Actinokineospora auranticolor]
MSTASRIALTATAGIAAALVLATPASATPTTYITTFPTLTQCTAVGDQAVAEHVFTSYTCRNGVAGYDLLGEPSAATFTDVYIATFGTQAACDTAGTNGETSPAAWTSHKCRSGFTGWDLLVTK